MSDEPRPVEQAARIRTVPPTLITPWHRAIAVVLTAPVIAWFTTATTWRPEVADEWGGSRFFAAQARALLHGGLAVRPSVAAGECFYNRGSCYGYFGLTPSLLRVPLVAVSDLSLAPVMTAVALLVAFTAATGLVAAAVNERSAPQPGSSERTTALAVFAAGCVLLGAGSALLVVSRPWMYEEAIAWSVAFGVLGLAAAWRWWRRGATGTLWLAAAMFTLAANARPTQVLPPLVIGSWIVVHVVRGGRQRQRRGRGQPRRSTLASAVVLALAPGLIAAAVFTAKFDRPVPDLADNEQIGRDPLWAILLARNGNQTTGLRFAPAALFAYFRPDGARFDDGWFEAPRFVFVTPLENGFAYVEPTVSLTALMPLPTAATVGASIVFAARAIRRRRGSRHAGGVDGSSAGIAPVLLLAALSAGVPTIVTIGVTQRYVVDFLPALVIGTAIVAPTVFHRAASMGHLARAAMLAAAIAACAWSVAANTLVGHRLMPPRAVFTGIHDVPQPAPLRYEWLLG